MTKRIEAVNDFVVKFANVNGSGSASANELFAKSFLRMGIPVSPRNIFPSNIQGLPTWYEVRVTEKGHLGRRGGVDLMVAMNPQTWAQDVQEIDPGGYLFYDNTKALPPSKFRDDINVIGMPLTDICNENYSDARERQLFKNIIYVGALAGLMGIEPGVIAELIGEQYKGKEKLLKPNLNAFQMGLNHAQEHLKDVLGLKVKRAYAVGDKIFMEGNAAAALGCVYGGATVCAWYPITPSSSLAERLQTPVFLMTDLDIGMNQRLCSPLTWNDERAYDRGKVMTAEMLDAGKEFGRYLDVDGDGIPFRTYPGTHPSKGAYFTRGTSRDRYARYTEEGAPYADNMQRLLRKFETAKNLVPRPVRKDAGKPTKYGVIYFGSTSPAMDEAIHMIEAKGRPLDMLRVRAFPFHQDVADFISDHDYVFVVEQNRDAQLRSLIVNECGIDPVRLIPILHYDGTPITARFIAREIADDLEALKVTPLRKVVS